jgi:YD repeat-containing protein
MLLSETVLNNINQPVKQLQNFYNADQNRFNSYVKGIFSSSRLETSTFQSNVATLNVQMNFLRNSAVRFYTYYPYLKKTVETSYGSDHSAAANVVTTDYVYDAANGTKNLIKSVRNDSQGRSIITSSKYAPDYSFSAVTPNQLSWDVFTFGVYNMLSSYAISSPVEKTIQFSDPDGSNLKTMKSTLITYDPTFPLPKIDYGTAAVNPIISFTPSSISAAGTYVKDPAYEEKSVVDFRDNRGNPLQMHRSNGPKTSYIWDLHQEFPIALISNATLDECAYTSFEEQSQSGDVLGAWKINAIPQLATDAPTGRRVYALSAQNTVISPNLISSGVDYVISYWSKGSAAVITNPAGGGIPGVAKTSKNGWTYYEHRFQSSYGSYSITGNVMIDELRLSPARSQMVTYTYDPLVGMTSMTDAKGITTTYEYDSFQRLQNIKDKDGYIIKSYCYNYAGQQGSCSIFNVPPPTTYINEEHSSTLSRNDCAVGYQAGPPVTLKVERGTYTSTVSKAAAEQQALDYLAASAQAYANQNGLCLKVYPSGEQRATLPRNNCGVGYGAGAAVTYIVQDGAFTSTISQGDADQQAVNFLNAHKQEYANTNGFCSNLEKTVTVNKNTCTVGYAGTGVKYTVQAGIYSASSPAGVDQQIQNDINTLGQASANSNGECLVADAAQWQIGYGINDPQGHTVSITVSRTQADINMTNTVYYRMKMISGGDVTGWFTMPAGTLGYTKNATFSTPMTGNVVSISIDKVY